ncbi:murein biosynthesis integral membrane protein MurJ [Clostridium chromiireducens]|uniref:Probable lipid II flippase MurJ n=1 Tax=Clostridium chromiireducens TaxID=225345 RepID=A0A399IPQ8_9CLOT|nr:murein biosynthesis integral membrane protein MurJ [Clostridium chromiireducens]RII35018.1 murein biosynthesis integral membrane protein MurJ [Clostridium chromiireducens]
MRNSILKTASLMIMFNLFSKVLGFLRDYFTAVKFGTTREADAYLMASNIPNVLFVIIGTSIMTIIIPVYNEIKCKAENEELEKFTSNMITILFIVSLILTIFCELFAPQLVKIMAPGFSGYKYTLTVLLTRILASVIILNTLIYTFTAILQCENNFSLPASIGIPYNIVLIIYLIFYIDKFGVTGISAVVSIALIIQICILTYGLKKIKFKYKFYLNFKDKNFKKILTLLMPICIGTGMTQINGVFNGIYASSLDSGSVAAINYALKLNALIVDIIIVSITTIIYQNLTKVIFNSEGKTLYKETNRGIITMFIVLIPIVIIAAMYSQYIVKFLFQRGAFNSESTMLTAKAFYYYSLGLFAIAINNILSRVCYSLGDTKTPMINTFLAILVNISTGFILKDILGVGGIALASTIGSIVSVIALYFNINKKVKNCISKNTVVSVIKLFISCIPLILFIMYSKEYIININSSNVSLELIKIGIISMLGCVIYVCGGILLKIEEFRGLKNILNKFKFNK